ncbi:U11/U12 small nuclear ribonucleoprotein [Araneus ventricosus]|uniref:U11/U12 small nuclear ribonucleoprotein n=1 Tax=Araneus ventricosus TaxID=182803 RepID=A0A4Y2K882_ARAVE|nr:U11/U12 small nuclear ribonucleoprotein [Araneus ventricosus]
MDLNSSATSTQPNEMKVDNLSIENSEDSKLGTLLHQEALALVENGITEIIKSDPLLQYLPLGVTLDELNSLLALEHGRAMTVIIHRADKQKYSVVVEQKATVIDLKKAIQRHVTLKLKREGCERTISWRYIWRTYWLYYDGQKLTDNDKPLKDYGIRNNSELSFIKRLRNK